MTMDAQVVVNRVRSGDVPADWAVYRARKLTALSKAGFAGACLVTVLVIAASIGRPVVWPAWLLCLLVPLQIIGIVAWGVGQFRASWSVKGNMLILLRQGFVEVSSTTRAVLYSSLACFILVPEQFYGQHNRTATLRWKTVQGVEDTLVLDERYGEPVTLALNILDAYAGFTAANSTTELPTSASEK